MSSDKKNTSCMKHFYMYIYIQWSNMVAKDTVRV